MKRQAISLLLVATLLVSALAGAAGTVAAQEGTTTTENETTTANNSTGTSLSVGQQLGVVISAQSTDIKGELDEIRFEHQLKNSENREATAHEQADQLRAQVNALREERSALINEFRNGTLSKSEFLAQLSTVNHKLDTTTEVAAQAELAARMHGVNADALSELRSNASNLTGGEISAIAREVGQHGKTTVDVRADKNGNVRFTENGETIGVEYEVGGNSNLNIDITRDNQSVVLTVSDSNGEPVESATVSANDQTVGTTDKAGQVVVAASTLKTLSQADDLELSINKGDKHATLEVDVEDAPSADKIREFREKHEDRRADQHEKHHEQWNDRHEKFHENWNESREDAEEAHNESKDAAHEKFHEKRDAARDEFEATWDDREDEFEAKLDAQDNLTDEETAQLEAEFNAKLDAANADFNAKWDEHHKALHNSLDNASAPTDDHEAAFEKSHTKFHSMMDRVHARLHERLNRTSPNPPGLKNAERQSGEPVSPKDNQTRDTPETGDKAELNSSLNLDIDVEDSVVTVSASEEQMPAANATVMVEGEVIGQTNEDGQLEFEPSSEALSDSRLEIKVTTDGGVAEATVTLSKTNETPGVDSGSHPGHN